MLVRIACAYVIPLTTAALLLLLLDKCPLEDLCVALRRAVLIAWPATISATTVDWLK